MLPVEACYATTKTVHTILKPVYAIRILLMLSVGKLQSIHWDLWESEDAYSALIATTTVMPVRPMMAAVSDMAGSSASSSSGLKMALCVFSWKKRYPTYLQPTNRQ